MIEKIDLEQKYFHWADYFVFFLLTVGTTVIGLFIAYFYKPKQTEEKSAEKEIDYGSEKLNEYLLASRQLSVLPVALSLVGGFVSGVTILGSASEIYTNGVQYSVITLSIILMTFPVCYIYLPVFTKLGVHSSYEYLEKRFGRPIRTVCAVLFLLDEILFLPMIVHVPALAFQKVTGIPSMIIGTIMCVFCVIYTVLGGIKAVVHTDAWQVIIMILSVLIVFVIGLAKFDGFGPVFEAAKDGDRLNFLDFDPSIIKRQTFWTIFFGGFCYWTSFNAVNQTMVQRYLSLPTLKKARLSVLIFSVLVLLFVMLCCFSGLLIFYKFRNCDPITAGLIHHMDELFPLFVMEVTSKYPGIAGLFLSGIFGAGLSSLSVILNTTALVIMEDIGKGALKLDFSPFVATLVVKVSIIILGAISLVLILVLQKMSGILVVAYSLTALSASISFGIFNLGMLVPWSNWQGSLIGGIFGYLFCSWMITGQQLYLSKGWLHYESLKVDVSGCSGNVTVPTIPPPTKSSDIFPLYMVSYHLINPIGVLITTLIGSIASLPFGRTKLSEMDINLLSPIIHRFCKSAKNDTEQK